jgi:hypothetical protein
LATGQSFRHDLSTACSKVLSSSGQLAGSTDSFSIVRGMLDTAATVVLEQDAPAE